MLFPPLHWLLLRAHFDLNPFRSNVLFTSRLIKNIWTKWTWWYFNGLAVDEVSWGRRSIGQWISLDFTPILTTFKSINHGIQKESITGDPTTHREETQPLEIRNHDDCVFGKSDERAWLIVVLLARSYNDWKAISKFWKKSQIQKIGRNGAKNREMMKMEYAQLRKLQLSIRKSRHKILKMGTLIVITILCVSYFLVCNKCY